MSQSTLNIIIPMAGYGTRMRPHTWSKPKPLVSAAGKSILGHVLDLVSPAATGQAELAFIVGYLGEQVQPYMRQHYPHLKARYYTQTEMRGQSHAIAMAREHLQGPTLILFVDTIVDTDFTFLRQESADAIIWVKPVEDPRRFGVVLTDEEGYVTSMVEKPESMENNLAIVGYYYFQRGEDLMAAIDRQITLGRKTKGEYFLADAMDLMLKDGLKMRAQTVDVWLDAGLPETVLETNRYLLTHGRDNTAAQPPRSGVTLRPPVFIHPEAEVQDSTIGPHVSIGAGCRVTGSEIEDSILETGAQVQAARLRGSIVGQRASVTGVDGIINLGDDSAVKQG